MMEKKTHRTLTPFGVLLILVTLIACSAPTPTPQPTETAPFTPTGIAPTSSPEAGTPAAGDGLCMNVYYPIRQGATWTYRSTGGPAGEYSFTDTITFVRPDGFTLSTQMRDLTRTQTWTCTTEGLTALQVGGAPAAMLSAQNIQLDLNVTEATGVVFPVHIEPGDQWQHLLQVEGSVSMLNQKAEATGNAQMNFAAAGTESVTVPAGTFDALRVDVAVTLQVDAAYEGIVLPVTFSGTYTYWFAPGVGWVKSSGTGNVLGTGFSEITELQSYNIPQP